MIRETYYTLSEAFELIGRRLHGDAWTGDESDTGYCLLTEDDIATRQAWKEKVVEPSRFPGDSEPDGAPEEMMRLRALARDAQTEPINIIRLQVWEEMSAGMGPKMSPGMSAEMSAEMLEEFNLLRVDSHAQLRLENLLLAARVDSLNRLRSGVPLSDADFAILDELEKEHHAVDRRESVMCWVTNRAWSGDDSEVALTGYIHTPDDGKITSILAHCWGAQSFDLSLYNNKATVDDQSWPADGVLVFLKSQLDAVLESAQGASPMAPTSDGAAEPTPSPTAADGANKAGRPTRKGDIEAAYLHCLGAKRIDFDAPKTRLYELIRETIGGDKSNPNLYGLGDEAIRKVISPLFETDKNKRSASP